MTSRILSLLETANILLLEHSASIAVHSVLKKSLNVLGPFMIAVNVAAKAEET